jgi:hypothetical protein
MLAASPETRAHDAHRADLVEVTHRALTTVGDNHGMVEVLLKELGQEEN